MDAFIAFVGRFEMDHIGEIGFASDEKERGYWRVVAGSLEIVE